MAENRGAVSGKPDNLGAQPDSGIQIGFSATRLIWNHLYPFRNKSFVLIMVWLGNGLLFRFGSMTMSLPYIFRIRTASSLLFHFLALPYNQSVSTDAPHEAETLP